MGFGPQNAKRFWLEMGLGLSLSGSIGGQ